MVRSLLTAAAALAVAMPALAQDVADNQKKIKPLTIGSEAPEIDIAHWIKGDPVKEFEDDKVYVLEFWATWCGPCVASMPHLSEMQKKYRDYNVTFIGVSDEPLQKVVGFLFKEYKTDKKIHNDRTHYTLTTDPDKSVFNSYFKAAARSGIPCAFVIGKDQKVEWIGHPQSGLDEVLGQVVRDEWDRDAFKAGFEKELNAERMMQEKQGELRTAYAASDWDKVLSILDEVIEVSGNPRMKSQKFMVLALNVKDYERAYAFAADVVDDSWDNPQLLNEIAWTIVDNPQIETRNFDLAMKAAKRASELTKDADGAILDTVARVYFETGHLEKALKLQRKAVQHAEGAMKEQLEETLKKYEEIASKGL